MYLQPEAIGCIVHQANKALCEVLGDDSQKDWVVTIPDIKDVLLLAIVKAISGFQDNSM